MAIFEIIRQSANRAIRYESHFDKAVSLGENLVSMSNQNHSQYMIKAKRLTSWYDQIILKFDEEILNEMKFEGLRAPQKKGGFFQNLFSKNEDEEEDEEEEDVFKRKRVKKEDWEKIGDKEMAFILRVKKEAKMKIGSINEMIEDDLVLRDTTRFELESNYLSEVIEENPFLKFKGNFGFIELRVD
jgi:hypothetical protein